METAWWQYIVYIISVLVGLGITGGCITAWYKLYKYYFMTAINVQSTVNQNVQVERCFQSVCTCICISMYSPGFY